MKKVLMIVALAVLSIPFFFTGSAEASTLTSESLSKNLNIESFKQHILQSIKSDYPNATFIDSTQQQEANVTLNENLSTLSTTGSAPPLTYLETYAVWSSNYNNGDYEYFDANQLSSVNDHGGAEMYIVTAELGYGHVRTAELDGNTLSSIDYQAIDLNGDTIVDGWYHWWDASGYEDGTFNYQNISSNYPWNTMYDTIFIQ